MQKFFQRAVGYIAVIGIIALTVSVLIYFLDNKGNKGKYAENIKSEVLYKVIDVYDGDTLVANVNGNNIVVRLIGIDTPEIVDKRKPVQCYGVEASLKAKEILLNKEIYLEKEKGKGDYDMYGRILAYVSLKDKTSYNKYMIENGYAKEYTFNKEKYKYQKEYKEAEEKAKKNKIGLWGKCKK
ncbi:MAG TPA: thermonuclease family protein [Candidatus Paceibacterota bacterium]